MTVRTRAPLFLLVPALAAAIIALVPLWYLIDQAASRGLQAVIEEIWQRRTLTLVLRSLFLTISVTTASVIVGVFCAWVVALSSVPLRSVLLVFFSLSLAIPSYLSAFAWISWQPQLQGFWGAFIVLTFVCYPYVMLPVVAAMRGVDPA